MPTASATRLEADAARHAPADRAAPPVAGHDLLRRIGRGSYGEVWLARTALGALRAVKIVRREDFHEARPFEREFEGICRFEPVSRTHDALMQVLHAGWGDDRAQFHYVMELADAVDPEPADVASYLPRTLRSEAARGALPIADCTAIGLALAQGLAHLHRHGLVHRDLKPSNILFVNGRAKLADIGLVGLAGEVRSVVGTEGFVPREGTGRPQADVFGLGKVLYEIATGKDRHDFPAIPAAWVGDAVALEFNEVLLRACEADPARRYASADELAADLAQLQAGRSLRRARGLERQLRVARRAAALLVGVALAALGAGAFARWQHGREQALRVRAELAESGALLAQADALVRSERAGQRLETLALVRQVAARTPSPEARRVAAAALRLPDVRVVTQGAFGLLETDAPTDFSPALEHAVRCEAAGKLVVLDSHTGASVATFQSPAAFGTRRWAHFHGPDLLVSQASDNVVRGWDWRRGRQLWEIAGAVATIRAAGASLRVILARGVLGEFEARSGRLLREVPFQNSFPRGQAEAGGQRLAWAKDKTITVWSSATGAAEQRFDLPAIPACFALDHRGELLAAGFGDGAVMVWDLRAGALRHQRRGHATLVHGLAFHPSGEWLASTSWDGTTKLWNSANGAVEMTFATAGVPVEFSGDGTRLGLVSYAGDVLLLATALPGGWREFAPPPGAGLREPLQLDAHQRLLVQGTGSGFACYDWRTGRWLAARAGSRTHSSAFDGDALLLGGETACQRWPVRTEGGALVLGPPQTHGEAPDRDAGSAVRGGQAVWWIDGAAVRCFADAGGEKIFPAPALLTWLAVSRDGRWLAAGAWKAPAVWLWPAHDPAQRRQFAVDIHAQVAFSPDGQSLVAGSAREYIFLNPATGAVQRRLARRAPSGAPGQAVFSPDGRLLVLTDDHAPVRLLEATTLAELVTFDGFVPGSQFAFSPDSRWLFSQSAGLDLWSLRRELRALALDWPHHPPPPEPWPAAAAGIESVVILEK